MIDSKGRHGESISGRRLVDFEPAPSHNDGYYSGQGKIFLAKRDSAGNPGAFEFLGNCPKFVVFADGRIEILTEAWSQASWPFLFGGDCTDTRTDEFIGQVLRSEDVQPDLPAKRFILKPEGNPHEYYLVFDGINSAEYGQTVHLQLYRVTFDMAASFIRLISDDLEGFPLFARYHKDETRAALPEYGPYGRIYTWDRPVEKAS